VGYIPSRANFMIISQSHLTKNSLWMILSRFTAQGLAVIFTILLARRLGSADFGAYAFIAAILFVTNALTTFGTDMLLIREIAVKDDLTGLPAALMVQLVLSACFIAVVWSFGMRIPNQSQETVMALKVYSLALIPLAFFAVFTTALRGKQLMDVYALLNILVSLLQVGAVLILWEDNLILLSSYLLFVQTLAALLASLLCSLSIPHFWRSWHLSSFLLSSSFLKASAPIAFLTLLTMLYQRLGLTMLSVMTGPSNTGIFSAAARIVEASKTAHIAVFAALYPVMAQGVSLGDTRTEWSKPTRTSVWAGVGDRRRSTYFGFLFLGAILISLSLFVFAKPLVLLLYSNEFMFSINVLQILSWTLIPFTINTYLTLSFLAAKQEYLIGRALMISLLGMLILNLWWIPNRGSEGAAWASLIAECLQSITLLVSASSRVLIKEVSHEFSNLP
jgi:O-antigen/teichoic acid export membrane protein